MGIELNHIIIPARDKQVSAEFLAGVLNIPVGTPWGPFVPVQLDNGVTLDYADASEFHSHHCAFLISEDEFDAAFTRIRDAGLTFYADPGRQQPGEINHRYGGRGVYFDDPDGHSMELITTPYDTTPPPHNVHMHP